MSKKIIISLATIIVIGGGILFTLTSKRSGTQDKTTSATTPSATSANETIGQKTTQNPNAANTGKYIDYSDGIVAKTSGIKVLFFHAPWCPQCQALERSIQDKGVPEGVTIIKIDYDSNQSLRQKYGVTIQTTLVKVDDNGNKIASYVAYDEPSIDSVKSNLL